MIPLLPRILGWPLKLPLAVVVVYEGESHAGNVSIGYTVASQVAVFYRSLGIQVQPAVSARIRPAWSDAWMDDAMKTHWFRLNGHEPTLIVRSDASVLPGDHWGFAFDSGMAVCVGEATGGAQHRWLSEIAVHEMGHLLGLSHEAGTFMDARIQKLRDGPVTPEQRRQLRETAFRLGGF